MTYDDVEALVRLQAVPKLGAVGLGRLLEAAHARGLAPTDVVRDTPTILGAEWAWVSDALAQQDPIPHRDAARQMLDSGWQAMTAHHPDYPTPLRATLGDKVPPVLYWRGAFGLFSAASVAFSGARIAGERALLAADSLARQAAQRGLAVVSGHAKGVDEHAHRATLDSGGTTVFVLSEGALRFRLRAGLRPLVQANPERALFVTQYAPNEVWQVGSAMQRNRTILGLSRALFIIEAGLDGGTWDAALEAERLKHPLYVLDLPSTERGNGAILARGVAQPIDWQGDLPQFPDLTSPPKQLSLW